MKKCSSMISLSPTHSDSVSQVTIEHSFFIKSSPYEGRAARLRYNLLLTNR